MSCEDELLCKVRDLLDFLRCVPALLDLEAGGWVRPTPHGLARQVDRDVRRLARRPRRSPRSW